MKQDSIKSITAISVIIIFFCALSAAFVIGQGLVAFISPTDVGVVWNDANKALQLLVAIGRPFGGAAFFVLITTFLIKTIKGLRSGILFPKSNVPILYFSALALFIYNFCYSNGGILTGKDALLIDTDDIGISMILVVFAMIYKIAVKVSEENSLTI